MIGASLLNFSIEVKGKWMETLSKLEHEVHNFNKQKAKAWKLGIVALEACNLIVPAGITSVFLYSLELVLY